MGFFKAMGLSDAATLGATSVADDVLDLRDEDTKKAKILAVRSARQYKEWSHQADKVDSDLINVGQAAANAGGKASQAFFKSLSRDEQKGASLDFKARRTLDRDIDPKFFYLQLAKVKKNLGEGVPLYKPGVKSDEEEALAQKDAAYEPPGFFSKLGSIARGEADSDTPRKAALGSGYVEEDEVAAALRGDHPPRQSVVDSPLGKTVVHLRPLSSKENMLLEQYINRLWSDFKEGSPERTHAMYLGQSLLGAKNLFSSDTYSSDGSHDDEIKKTFLDLLEMFPTNAEVRSGGSADLPEKLLETGTTITDLREWMERERERKLELSLSTATEDAESATVEISYHDISAGGSKAIAWVRGLKLGTIEKGKTYKLTKAQNRKLKAFQKEHKNSGRSQTKVPPPEHGPNPSGTGSGRRGGG
jgi:hypothetical protein